MHISNSLKCSKILRWVLTIIGVVLMTACLSPTSAVTVKPEQAVYCTSKECLQSAASLIWSINSTVDPCDNFYKYVCGNPESFTYGHKYGFMELNIHMKTMVHNFIKTPSEPDDPIPVQMVRDFYSTCMIEKDLSGETLKNHLRSAGLPDVPSLLNPYDFYRSPFVPVTFDWINASVTLKKKFGVDLVAGLDMGDNVFGTDHVLYLRALQSSQTGPLRFFDRIRTEMGIRRIIEKVVKYSIIDESRSKKAARIIYEMVFRNPMLAKKDDEKPIILKVTKKIKKMTVGELQNLTDARVKISGIGGSSHAVSWKRWIGLLISSIAGTEVNVDSSQEFHYIQSDLQHLIEIHSYLSKRSAAEIELFVWFKVVMFILKHTIAGEGKRVDYCTELTETYLNTALGFGIIPKDFITDVKPEVVEFLENFKETFAEHIDKSQWLDTHTKVLAKKKIKSLTYAIGAPDWINNETAVLQTYDNVTISKLSHLDNILSITQLSVRNTFKQFINGHDENHNRETTVKITSMNTYYNVLQNFINIPWGMLHSPVYHLGLRSLNYGALGTVIGHEITHGFDEDGIYFDHDANFKRWFGSSSLRKYKKNTGCFIKQYSNFTVNMDGIGMPVDANRTLNENIADNVGAKIAYYALQKSLKKNGPEQKLPGFQNNTSDQLFFLSNAHIWCGEDDSASFLKQLLQIREEHSPQSHRVNGPMQNLDAFSKTFNCPVGSPMNPDRPKCSVW